jgi:ABC-type microcin C transport system duplicated ATPase subunit YejF
VVKAASEYQVKVPEAQVPVKEVLSPEQMDAGVATTLVGEPGVGVTVTVAFVLAALSQPVAPFTHFAV